MLLKAICTMSYLTESHPRPHHMTWKLITMREKHLWRTTFSLTFSFAFDSCLVAKPNIRTRSVDCTGKRITRRLSIKKYSEVWVKSCQLVVWVRFRSDTTEASSGAIFFAYLSLFPVSTLDIYPSNPKLVASRIVGTMQTYQGNYKLQRAGTRLVLQVLYDSKVNTIWILYVFIQRVDFGLWSPNPPKINQSLARIHVICFNTNNRNLRSHAICHRRYWWYLLSAIQANFNYLPKAILKQS